MEKPQVPFDSDRARKMADLIEESEPPDLIAAAEIGEFLERGREEVESEKREARFKEHIASYLGDRSTQLRHTITYKKVTHLE